MSKQGMNITVIGCDGRPAGSDATKALAEARTVIGAPRHLRVVPVPPHAEQIELRHLDEALDALGQHEGPAVVLASGDPGFFGIVRALRARGITPRVIPAVSAVALAFAKIGLDWDDAMVVSAHGRDPRRALAAALAHPKAAILTAPGTARDLARELQANGKTVYAAELLGTPGERVAEAAGRDLANPNILISLDEQAQSEQAQSEQAQSEQAQGPPRWLAGHPGAPDGWALPEDAFEHRDSMITKPEVRALVLARLGPGPGRTIWDVGAGSGSVAVECARFGARVIAVEADPAQCGRIRRNAERHQVRLRVHHGRAPEALQGLPPADAVFAGGGDHAVLAAAIRHADPETLVVTLAAVDRVADTTALLEASGYQAQGVQLQASRLTRLPAGQHRLAAQNPVFVLWGQRWAER